MLLKYLGKVSKKVRIAIMELQEGFSIPKEEKG